MFDLDISLSFSVPNDETAACGSISTSETVLISENWPKKYPNNVDCEWFIQFEEGEKVQLEFTEFSVESSFNCR